MKNLAEFLHNLTFTNTQLSDTKGHLTRFLDIGMKLDKSIKPLIGKTISNGICKLYNNLSKTDSMQELLTHLFYDFINKSGVFFQSADESIIYSDAEELDFGLLTFCEYSDDIWIRVHPEYYDTSPYIYESDNFPPQGGTIIGFDSNSRSYPVMSGELWHLLSHPYGNKESIIKPDLIAPISRLKDIQFKSSWKVNHEMTVHCTAASHRNSGVLLDFQAGIDKITPFNYNLLGRNDVCAIGSYDYSNWMVLVPDNTVTFLDHLRNRCLWSIEQTSAFKIYQAKKKIIWICEMLLF